MRYFKYLAIAIVAVTMVACGDDEPSNTYTREFNMIYPQLAAGHKSISKIEKVFENGAKSVAVVDYDGEHVKRVTATYSDKTGEVYNEEVINFDYKNGAIICDKKIQDVTYAFEVNGDGAFTKLKNVTTSRTVSSLTYNGANQVELAQVMSPSSTDVTKVNWQDNKLSYWTLYAANKTDSVVYNYTTPIPNKGGIDVTSNNPFTFTTLVCEVMRNAGFFGATSAYLPDVVLKDGVTDSETGITSLKTYTITYELDSDGYVKSYTTSEKPKFTVKYTYR